MAILTDAERGLVEQCIAEVEQSTSAEIVVATLPQADPYADVIMGAAALLSLALVTVLHLLLPELTTGALLCAELGLFFAARLLVGRPALLRRCLPRGRIDAAMAAAAERLFLAHRVFDTRDHTGVLILLSELERRVTVLGDRGAHSVVQEKGWEAHVGAITAGLRTGRAAEGLCVVIRGLGSELTRSLPILPDDRNELPNHVRQHTRL